MHGIFGILRGHRIYSYGRTYGIIERTRYPTGHCGAQNDATWIGDMSGIALGLEGGAEFGSDGTTNRCIRCSGYVQLNRRERDSTAHVAAEMGREEAVRSGARNTQSGRSRRYGLHPLSTQPSRSYRISPIPKPVIPSVEVPAAQRPVWTALLWQGVVELCRCWSVRPCVRPSMRPCHRRWP